MENTKGAEIYKDKELIHNIHDRLFDLVKKLKKKGIEGAEIANEDEIINKIESYYGNVDQVISYIDNNSKIGNEESIILLNTGLDMTAMAESIIQIILSLTKNISILAILHQFLTNS